MQDRRGKIRRADATSSVLVPEAFYPGRFLELLEQFLAVIFTQKGYAIGKAEPVSVEKLKQQKARPEINPGGFSLLLAEFTVFHDENAVKYIDGTVVMGYNQHSCIV